MSREAVSEIVARAGAEAAFKDALLADPATTLAPYSGRLTEEERAALSAAASEPFALAALAASSRDPWWRQLVPSSFREVGGTFLSIVLVLAFLLALVFVLTRIGSDPRGVTVGGRNEAVDEYARAKDLLLIIVPLFGAVLTFWLGVAVEGRRADEHKQNAAQAGKERDDAKESERKKTTTAATVLAEIGQVVKRLRSQSGEAGTRGLPGDEPALTGELDELDGMLEEARRRIES
jgi:hypothetical protein